MLDTISHKLDFDDQFQFAGACKEWRRVQKIYWRRFLASQSPLLVQTTPYDKKYCSFYSIPEKRVYRSKRSFYFGSYCGSSSGYLIMAGANKRLHLMNPFTRKYIIIDTSTVGDDFIHFTSHVLLAFAKGSNEFVIVASCKHFFGLHVYQSRYSNWVTYSKKGNPCKVVDFVVLHNTIYALTYKAEICVLSLNSPSLKLLELKNTPNIPYLWPKLLSCDGKLLVVYFTPKKSLDVYRIDLLTMSYAKLETLGDLALFYSRHKCYALSNPDKLGYESNHVYYINSFSGECEVYSASNNELIKCIVPTGRPCLHPRSKFHWLDWCFRHLHDEVDYSLVE